MANVGLLSGDCIGGFTSIVTAEALEVNSIESGSQTKTGVEAETHAVDILLSLTLVGLPLTVCATILGEDDLLILGYTDDGDVIEFILGGTLHENSATIVGKYRVIHRDIAALGTEGPPSSIFIELEVIHNGAIIWKVSGGIKSHA